MNNQSNAVATVIFFLVVLNIPYALRTIRVLSPLKINREGTGFTGRFRRWNVRPLTGRVIATSSQTVTSGRSSFSGSSYSGVGTGGGMIITNVYDNFRLRTTDGGEHEVTVRNFTGAPRQGDVVTVCYAKKAVKWLTLAVLDHTTRQSYYNMGDLTKITTPRQPLAIFWMFVSALTIVGIPLLFVYGFASKRQRERFMSDGIQPLWVASSEMARVS